MKYCIYLKKTGKICASVWYRNILGLNIVKIFWKLEFRTKFCLSLRKKFLSLVDFLSFTGLEFSKKCWKKGCDICRSVYYFWFNKLWWPVTGCIYPFRSGSFFNTCHRKLKPKTQTLRGSLSNMNNSRKNLISFKKIIVVVLKMPFLKRIFSKRNEDILDMS